jgi:hypothetical protein
MPLVTILCVHMIVLPLSYISHDDSIAHSTILSSVQYPKIAAGLLGAWVAGRFFYTLGYSTGNPANRNGGLARLQYIGVLGAYLTVYSVG